MKPAGFACWRYRGNTKCLHGFPQGEACWRYREVFIMYQKRMERVLAGLREMGLSQMIICNPKSIFYLTGIDLSPMERLFALYIHESGNHKLFLNDMFTVPHTGIEEIWINDTQNAVEIVAANVDAAADMGIDANWPARFLLPLMQINGGVQYKLASDAVDLVRAQKDEAERERMREASLLNDRCMEALESFIHDGITEKACVDFISDFYEKNGASGCSFDPIVGFGPNAADPHHQSDSTVLKEGDCVLIDTGCVKDGYCSDMTRVFFWKKASEEHLKIHDIVRRANELAEAAIKPGVRFCDLDKIARDYISSFGYGEFFTHRLGHSIGIECHEHGDVSAVNEDVVKVGNAFSIEPGIYLKGDVGVRIEDLVIVTEDGCEILNHYDKEYKILT